MMRSTIYFPAILFRQDGDGVAGCTIPGPNINAGGETDDAALADAAEVLQAVIEEALEEGEPLPEPATTALVFEEIAEVGAGVLVLIPASMPVRAAA